MKNNCSSRLLWALAAGLALPLAPAVAGPAPKACREAPPEPSGWLHREESIRAHGRLPQPCLRALVRECSEAANQALLDGDQAAVCSIRYEALLRYGFGGNFQALLAWWRDSR